MDNNFLSRYGFATELGLRKATDSTFKEIKKIQSEGDRFILVSGALVQTFDLLPKLKSEYKELLGALSDLLEYKEWNGYTGDDWQFQTEDGIQNQRENR